MRAYLCGAIEYAPDHGKRWRAELVPILRELGHHWYDPAKDERKNLSAEEQAHFREWKTSDFARFQQAVRKLIHFDIDRIENETDYIICFWDEYAGKGAGTQAELTIAFRRCIPVYMVIGMPREKVSGWLLGCADEVFEDFDSLKTFLRGKYAAQLTGQAPR